MTSRKRKLRVIALVPEGAVPPQSLEGLSEQQIAECKMEYDVISALQRLGQRSQRHPGRSLFRSLRHAHSCPG